MIENEVYRIIRACCVHFAINYNDFFLKTRSRPFPEVRAIAHILIREQFEKKALTVSLLAKIFNRDRSTLIYYESYEKYADKDFKIMLDGARAYVKENVANTEGVILQINNLRRAFIDLGINTESIGSALNQLSLAAESKAV